MATQLQIRRGTTAQMNAFTGAEGELAVNTSTDTVHVHDGATAGGFALAKADGSNIGTYAGSFTTISASGAITGNVTGNLTGSVLTAAQTNITSVGTLSTLAVSGALTVDTNTLVVDATNNRVGIGTVSPASLLDAAGAPLATSGAISRIRNTSATASNTSYGGVLFSSSPGTDFSIGKSNVNAATSLSFRNGNTGASLMELTSSGNVGIGTSSPYAVNGKNLTVRDSLISRVVLENSGASGRDYYLGSGPSGEFNFYDITASTERMRIDGATGSLMVGKSVTTFNTTGMQIDGSNGNFSITASGATTAFFNRTSSDGAIAEFYKDGAPVGSIGVNGGDLYIENGITGISFNNAFNALIPTTTGGVVDDANQDLGISSHRFKDLHLSGGVNPTANVVGNSFTQPNNGSDSITAGWISSSFGKNSNKVVIGSHSSQAVVGAHNNDLDAWADLHIQATNIKFLNTAGGQTAAIDSSGNFLVGTTAVPSGGTNSRAVFKGNNSLGVQGATAINTGDIGFYNLSGAKYWSIASNQTDWYFADANFSNYALLNQNMTAWVFGSDRRLKEDIVDVPYGLDAVMAIQPRAFTFKSSGVKTIGFIAQELREVVPEAVTGTEVEYLDSDTAREKAEKSLGVGKDTLIPVLVKAIQEQQATIEALTQRIETLENN